ncbi:MAG: hypothetical protein ACRDH2_19250, partial [Anaerolineales bacterium]
PHRPIVWSGYRDIDDTTAATQLLEGNVWQAGADPDALLLGVTFMTPGRIAINTIHRARPRAADTTTIADGLIILTYPAKARR